MPFSVLLFNVKMPSSSNRNVPAGSIHARFGIIKVHSGFLCFFFQLLWFLRDSCSTTKSMLIGYVILKTLKKLYFELFKMDK